MGEVFRALDLRLQRDVALKVIRMDKGEQKKSTERLRREARALATLRHPNVVRLLDFDEDSGIAFLAMEFVDGEPLNKVIEDEGKLKPDRAAAIGASIAEGLSAAHDRGIIHRDIKPDNILISSEGVPIVIDFGLATGAEAEGDPSLTKTGHFVGTPKFVPPEVITGTPFSALSDLYQLGLVIYQMLTGVHPLAKAEFIDVARGTALAAVKAPSKLNPEVDGKLDEIVMSLLERDAAKRPASARQLAKTLNDFRSKERGAKSQKPPKGKKAKRQRHRKVMLFLMSFTLVFIIGLTLLILLNKRVTPAMSEFVMPKGLVFYGRRGKLIPKWKEPGDAAAMELRAMNESSWRVIPLDSSLSGLRPGSKYRVRFRSADNRHSPSQTVTIPYSAISFDRIEDSQTRKGALTVVLKSQFPILLKILWEQKQRSFIAHGSKKKALTHRFSFHPRYGYMNKMKLLALEAQGKAWSVALPSKSLVLALSSALRAIKVEKHVKRLGLIYQQERRRGGDLPKSEYRENLEGFLKEKEVRELDKVRPFVPLLFGDEALTIEEKLLLYRRINKLLPLDRLFQAVGRRSPFNVESLLSQFSHLSKTEFNTGKTIAAWPGGRLLRPGENIFIEFNVAKDQLVQGYRCALLVKTNAFHYRNAMQLSLNEKIALNYHFKPHSILLSRFASGKGKALDTVEARRRCFPDHLLNNGSNKIRISVIPLMGNDVIDVVKIYEVRVLLVEKR